MERTITDKEKEIILNLGAFEYDNERCAHVLGWDTEYVNKQMDTPESEFYILYQRGLVRAQYVIDLKLFEQAQSGDIKSLEKLEKRKNQRK